MSIPAIDINSLSYRYPRTKQNVLDDVNLTIDKGEFVAILGENGAGKSTFCQILNGVIPQSVGGLLKGTVLIEGLDTTHASIAQLAQRVGIVLEDPETQLFTTSVLSEVAFGPENLSVPADEIRKRARWALNIVRLEGYEDRQPTALSGGQKQRLAIAAALTMQPSILVLDESTSQLDPLGVIDVFTVVRELNQEYGMTIVMATDKSEEVARVADRVIVLHEGKLIASGTPREIYADTNLFKRFMIRSPQVSQLATRVIDAGYPLNNLPISVKEAEEEITQLLVGVPCESTSPKSNEPDRPIHSSEEVVIQVEDVGYVYQPHNVRALNQVSFDVRRGEFVALIGQNGSGKTTLLKNLLGLLSPTAGRILVGGLDTREVTVADLATRIGFVLQNPDQQLFAETVEDEIAFGPKNLGLGEEETKARVDEALELVGLEGKRSNFPPALAKGDRAKVVIASALAMHPEIIILDEPTTGQDFKGCHQIMSIAQALNDMGRTVIVVTHYMALVAEYSKRVIVLSQGEILLDDTTEVVFSQPAVLRQTYVAPPQITELGWELPQELHLPRVPLTIDDLVQPILARLSTFGV